MAPRLELQALLRELVGSDNVYFQPPSNVQMQYPCIVYRREDISIEHADNKPYRHTNRYQITVIDPKPDSEISAKVSLLPTCSFDRFFVADNLNHDVFNLSF